MNLSNKRKEAPIPEGTRTKQGSTTRNQRKKIQRLIKKAKLEEERVKKINEKLTINSDTCIDIRDDLDKQVNDININERPEIFYNPDKHKTQKETRKSTKEETINYIRSQWVSVDFDAEDLKSTNIYQPSTIIGPKSTFIEKFLEKRSERRIANQVPIDDISSIPEKYMKLLEAEIFHEPNVSESIIPQDLWNEFGQWACFNKVPYFRKKFRYHCRRLWSKISHAHEQRAKTQPLEKYDIPEMFHRHPKDKLVIADETTKKIIHNIHLDGYRYILKTLCIKNVFGETIVDFFDLGNLVPAKIAQLAVDKYYNHTRMHPTHQTKQFINNLAEQFGCLTDSNNEPYVTASTASNHSQEHQGCVKELIRGLQPLSDAINNYLDVTYPALYAKMKKLDLGSNVPKSFGAFPTVGINFNSICQFHRDLKDHRNTLCVVCPLGTFEGGHVVFPELMLAVNVKQGQAIAFRSHFLVHGNLPIITGARHSVVFYIHDTVIKQKRKFSSLSDDLGFDPIVENERIYTSPKLRSPTKLKNHRRIHIDIERAKKGLSAQYKK